jgi:predicted MFS family arabinose efflux permease
MSSVSGLGKQPDFLKVWGGQTISLLGSEVTLLALPLTAILVLQATPLELGILGAVQSAPFLLLSLPAGVWVDRFPRRPVLIVADVGRAVLLASVPLAALANALSIELVYVVALCTGSLTAIFDVAYQSFLPRVVIRDQLVDSNTKLEISRSIAQIAGPSTGGFLVQWLTAPIAIAADAASFSISALAFAALRRMEPSRVAADDRRSIVAEMRDGFSVILVSPLLRTLAGAGAAYNLCGNVLFAVFLLYATNGLRLQPAAVGLILSVAGPAGLVGALLASRIPDRIGLGPTLIGMLAVGAIGRTIIFAAGGPIEVVVLMLVVARALLSVWVPIYSVTALSLRQGITPDQLQGRVNATNRFLQWGTLPIGSLIGGALGEAIGLRPTIGLAVLGTLVAVVWFALSPVRQLREPPAALREAAFANG